jgi:Flp pilus assembly pilin Flp
MRGDEPIIRTTSRLSGDSGANLVEYSMLVALIFVVALAAVQLFGKNATTKMSCASSAITNSAGTTC